VAANIGLEYTNPYTLVFMRFLLASSVIGVLTLGFERKLKIRRELRKAPVWLLGLIDALGFLLQYIGQSLTNAADATLLANLAPVLVPVVAWNLTESVSKTQAFACAIGLSGLVMIAIPNFKPKTVSVTGDLLLLGSSACYALFIVLSKRFNAASAGSALAVIVTITVFLSPAALILGGLTSFGVNLGRAALCSSLYMGVACTVVPMVLYLRGLRSISSSESGTLLLIEVLSGMMLTVLILREVPTMYELAAGSAISFALAVGVFRK
jgi:drug/metabolite transporter (DMT)-like permease